MKRLAKVLRDIFTPKDFQGLDSSELLDALADPVVRKIWLYEIFEELKRMNQSIDAKLLMGSDFRFKDVCIRRQAYQTVLEEIKNAKAQVHHQNPKSRGQFDLDSVTVGSAS